jgi:two-component sensor histidine kinase
MITIDDALKTLEKLQSAAPPVTAQKLADVIAVVTKLQDENTYLYARWIETVATAEAGSPVLPELNPAITPATHELPPRRERNLSTDEVEQVAPQRFLNTADLVLPFADTDTPEPYDEAHLAYESALAEILASRPVFDTDGLPGTGVLLGTGVLSSKSSSEPALDDLITGVLPNRGTQLTPNAPTNDAILQRVPALMRPTLLVLREQGGTNGTVRSYTESALSLMKSLEQIHDLRRGMFTLNPFTFPPKELVKQARKQLLPLAAAYDQQILFTVDEDLPDVLTDGESAFTILCDLLDNAIRYTPPSGTIRLTCDTLGTHLLLTVSDSGIGLTEEEISHMGVPFWRASYNPQVAKQPGAGLRLYLARHILAMMGGEMFISGEEGAGSSISFTLPIMRPES